VGDGGGGGLLVLVVGDGGGRGLDVDTGGIIGLDHELGMTMASAIACAEYGM